MSSTVTRFTLEGPLPRSQTFAVAHTRVNPFRRFNIAHPGNPARPPRQAGISHMAQPSRKPPAKAPKSPDRHNRNVSLVLAEPGKSSSNNEWRHLPNQSQELQTMDADLDNPVVLANLPTDAQAALLVNRLESLGIRALISGAGGATGWPEAGGYTQVVVRQADLERAQAALDATTET
jgi:hypothetical protein